MNNNRTVSNMTTPSSNSSRSNNATMPNINNNNKSSSNNGMSNNRSIEQAKRRAEEALMDAVLNYSDKISDYFTAIILVFKILIFIFFAYHFIKKTQNIRNNYFYFLFIGFFWDIIYDVIFIIELINDSYIIFGRKTTAFAVFDIVDELSRTYMPSFSAVWVLLLTVMRFTAIVWWQKYDAIWSKLFYPALILLHLSPFIIQIYTVINYQCLLNLKSCKDSDYDIWVDIDAYVFAISGIIIAGISLLISIITVVIYRIKIKKDMALKQSPDRKLLFQALVTSFLLVLFSVVQVDFLLGREEGIFGVVMEVLNYWTYSLYPISAYVLCFVFSPALRKQLLEFYHLTWLKRGQLKTSVKISSHGSSNVSASHINIGYHR